MALGSTTYYKTCYKCLDRSYPRIDSFSNLSNHLIAISPKLEGNILHIKVSFLEYMAML